MDNRMRDLLRAALDKTDGGELQWTAFDAESFRAKVGPGYLHIQRGTTPIEDDDGERVPAITYNVQIADAQGRVVAEDNAVQGFLGNEFTLLDGVFRAARKSALKTDRVIDDMLHALRG